MIPSEFITNVVLHPASINKGFFHFTDIENIPSIAKDGLLSRKELEKRGMRFTGGGNQQSIDVDRSRGLDEYVHLCFTESHPMRYLAQKNGTIGQSMYLRIDPEVLHISGAKITCGVANKTGVQALDPTQGIAGLDLEVLYKRTNWSDPAIKLRLANARKCEILIPKLVPVNLIKNLP